MSDVVNNNVAEVADHARWGASASYDKSWSSRGVLAASFIPNGASVLEIGVGTGTFREEIKGRCLYLGADLNPLDDVTLVLNMDTDPLPVGAFDIVVMLGVLEYLADPFDALIKAKDAAPELVFSYCSVLPNQRTELVLDNRRSWGWLNDLNQFEIFAFLNQHGIVVRQMATYNLTDSFVQNVFLATTLP